MNANADAHLNNADQPAGQPTYRELLAALRVLDEEAAHTMHKPAGTKAFDAVVIRRELFDEKVRALLARAGTPA